MQSFCCPDQEELNCVFPVVSGFHPYLGSELLGKGGGEHSMILRTDLLGERDSTEVTQGSASSGRQVCRREPTGQEEPTQEKMWVFKVHLRGLGKWDQLSNTDMIFSSKLPCKLDSKNPLVDENTEIQRDKDTCQKSHSGKSRS